MVRGSHLLAVVIVISSVASETLGLEKHLVYNNNGLGTYSFEFETPDGTYRREDGGLNPESGNLVVRGEYGYIDTFGRLYTVRYIADENGFQPQTSDLIDTRFNDRRIV